MAMVADIIMINPVSLSTIADHGAGNVVDIFLNPASWKSTTHQSVSSS